MLSAALFVLVPCLTPVFDVDHYGAVADNRTVNTRAFRAAAAAAAANGGGLLRVGGPGVYVTGAFNLSSGVTLEVTPNATILGVASIDPFHFPIIAPLPSYGTSRDGAFRSRHQALVMTPAGASGVRITGGGVIDGGGPFWWRLHNAKQLTAGRPRLIELYNATHLEVDHVTLRDSAFWTLHPIYCRDVHLHDLTIRAPGTNAPNTDGIDPDSSSDVLIERCDIDVGDDQIAIKSGMDGPGRAVGLPSRNITVRGNVHRHGHGISIGSEVSGGVEDVLIEDVQHLGPAKHGLNIKTAAQRGGYIRNVTYRRIEIGQVDVGSPLITLTTSYVEVTAANAPPSAETPADEPLTVISGLRYESIRRAEGYADATSAQRAGSWQCFGDAPCKGVSLADVALDGVAGWSCSHVVGGVARNVTPGGLTECFGSGEA